MVRMFDLLRNTTSPADLDLEFESGWDQRSLKSHDSSTMKKQSFVMVQRHLARDFYWRISVLAF